ncbi:wall-associated receptor kinase 2 [Ziziphus jujuba]|uniref:Wall-associated receptor kinase 2 n=1 Tax=Ziziphus jujuba TaxID=326968 RepID=A0A6P4BEN8_ZIZJJ|nr:wall-associated receptor kinase 2 [Ziziphus jujuba]
MNSKQFLIHLVSTLLSIAFAAKVTIAVESQSISLPGCPDHCGEIKVPYPFGITQDCSFPGRREFYLNCTQSSLFLNSSNIEIINISLDGELSIKRFIGRDCYAKNGERENNRSWLSLKDHDVCSDRNTFMAVGCNTVATISGYRGDREYDTGCISTCDNMDFDNFTSNHQSCSGVGCCQIPIPDGLKSITVSLSSYDKNRTFVYDFNPCSYAFVVEQGKFKFSKASFRELNHTDVLPMVLNWGIGKESCDEAKKRDNSACKGNTKCANNSLGYLCQCLPGYEGNPYHPDGCQDIDECKIESSCGKNSKCQNLPGNWTCICPKGYYNTSKMDCSKSVSNNQLVKSVLPICIAVGVSILLLTATLLVYWGMKKRKMLKLKEKFFEQNGGLMLQQHLSSGSQSQETAKIFSAEELQRATDNFHESRVLGQGGYGIVYKGILPSDNKVVAIKKSKFGAEKCNEQFINEVILLLQINHRNVVKLLGCCLETEVPLLVYEYVENGTLFEHIHNKGQGRSPLSWELRLKIATEAASALAYLHSATSTPIIHRDVKTGNILLDKKYTAKVSDFGASRLIPLDQNLLTTVVQGTFGYLDPEYMHTSHLTEKSDVYSFGVVLAELLTGRKVMSFDRPENERNLALFFVSSMKEDRLLEILDNDIITEGNTEAFKNIANLAERCLRIKSEERPSMKDVAMELEGQRAMAMQQLGQGVHMVSQKTENLPTNEPSDPYAIDISGPLSSQ